MALPAWASKLIGGLAVLAVVSAAKGIGWCCRRVAPNWKGIAVAVLIGAAVGFGAGAALAWWWFPARLDIFVPFVGGFCALVGAIQSGLSAGGVGGTGKVRVGE